MDSTLYYPSHCKSPVTGDLTSTAYPKYYFFFIKENLLELRYSTLELNWDHTCCFSNSILYLTFQ